MCFYSHIKASITKALFYVSNYALHKDHDIPLISYVAVVPTQQTTKLHTWYSTCHPPKSTQI